MIAGPDLASALAAAVLRKRALIRDLLDYIDAHTRDPLACDFGLEVHARVVAHAIDLQDLMGFLHRHDVEGFDRWIRERGRRASFQLGLHGWQRFLAHLPSGPLVAFDEGGYRWDRPAPRRVRGPLAELMAVGR
jgi:hypothetical protein